MLRHIRLSDHQSMIKNQYCRLAQYCGVLKGNNISQLLLRAVLLFSQYITPYLISIANITGGSQETKSDLRSRHKRLHVKAVALKEHSLINKELYNPSKSGCRKSRGDLIHFTC